MDYYFTKTIDCTFDEAIARTREALQEEGFGVITVIDMQEKLKDKLGVDFKRYTILGACNPPLAYKALQHEEKIGTMLPCNVLVIEQGPGRVEVAAVNPIASMASVQNAALGDVAGLVTEKMQKVVASLK